MGGMEVPRSCAPTEAGGRMPECIASAAMSVPVIFPFVCFYVRKYWLDTSSANVHLCCHMIHRHGAFQYSQSYECVLEMSAVTAHMASLQSAGQMLHSRILLLADILEKMKDGRFPNQTRPPHLLTMYARCLQVCVKVRECLQRT
jgi:hypothetical protein